LNGDKTGFKMHKIPFFVMLKAHKFVSINFSIMPVNEQALRQQRSEERGWKSFIWIVVVFLVVVAIASAIDGNHSSTTTATPAAVPAAPTTEQITHYGAALAMTAIRNISKDPEGVHFLEQAAEQYYPATGIYVAKWRISGTNSFGARVQAYGVASVKYRGGDVYSTDNWELESARIIE
jgi:hypothetical protein